MAKYPVAGTKGKSWKVTSPYGWRVHPISKAKKHHNGVDIWQAKEPTLLRACFAGTVVGVSTSTDPNGAGNKVIVQSTVNGKKITWTYFHMVKGSIKVKKGQVIAAGEIVGKMGETGFATGKHLHWEIWSGHRTTQPNINGGGKGFLDPMKFMKSVLDVAKPLGETETPPPVIGDPPSVKQSGQESPVTPLETIKPLVEVNTFTELKEGSKGAQVKKLQTLLKITSDGIFGPITKKTVIAYQNKKGIKATGIVDLETWERLNK
jgi:murein DD-endopeptidase MepM/ murein hydrolase activator NlpD